MGMGFRRPHASAVSATITGRVATMPEAVELGCRAARSCWSSAFKSLFDGIPLLCRVTCSTADRVELDVQNALSEG
jgi:hypothetical protein